MDAVIDNHPTHDFPSHPSWTRRCRLCGCLTLTDLAMIRCKANAVADVYSLVKECEAEDFKQRLKVAAESFE